MKYLILTLLFSQLMGCDAPQRVRTPGSLENSVLPGGLSNPVTEPAFPNTTSGSTSGTTPLQQPGFTGCDLTPRYYAAAIGYIGICQSTLDETSLAVRPTISDSSQTCLIPTYKDASG